MWPFKKEREEPENEPEESEVVTFRADDIPMVRARKIWKAIGMANDRFGAIPQIAGFLSMYRDWDLKKVSEQSAAEERDAEHKS